MKEYSIHYKIGNVLVCIHEQISGKTNLFHCLRWFIINLPALCLPLSIVMLQNFYFWHFLNATYFTIVQLLMKTIAVSLTLYLLRNGLVIFAYLNIWKNFVKGKVEVFLMESWMQKCNIFGSFWNKVLKLIWSTYYDYLVRYTILHIF